MTKNRLYTLLAIICFLSSCSGEQESIAASNEQQGSKQVHAQEENPLAQYVEPYGNFMWGDSLEKTFQNICSSKEIKEIRLGNDWKDKSSVCDHGKVDYGVYEKIGGYAPDDRFFEFDGAKILDKVYARIWVRPVTLKGVDYQMILDLYSIDNKYARGSYLSQLPAPSLYTDKNGNTVAVPAALKKV